MTFRGHWLFSLLAYGLFVLTLYGLSLNIKYSVISHFHDLQRSCKIFNYVIFNFVT